MYLKAYNVTETEKLIRLKNIKVFTLRVLIFFSTYKLFKNMLKRRNNFYENPKF